MEPAPSQQQRLLSVTELLQLARRPSATACADALRARAAAAGRALSAGVAEWSRDGRVSAPAASAAGAAAERPKRRRAAEPVAAASPARSPKRASATAAAKRVIIHLDLDCFFVQVHQRHEPSLRGLAVALQQHEDVIAVNYEAKARGVRR